MAILNISSLPTELLFKVFAYLPVRDLAQCAPVCGVFKRVIETEYLWKLLILRDEGQRVLSISHSLIEKGKISAKDAYRHASLVKVQEKITSSYFASPPDLNRDNPRSHSSSTETSYLRQPHFQREGYSFAIFNSFDVKVQGPAGITSLKGEEGQFLTHIDGDGHYLYALRADGRIAQWNYRTGSLSSLIETAYSLQDHRLINLTHALTRLNIPTVCGASQFQVRSGVTSLLYWASGVFELISVDHPGDRIVLEEKKLKNATSFFRSYNQFYFFTEQGIVKFDPIFFTFKTLNLRFQDVEFMSVIPSKNRVILLTSEPIPSKTKFRLIDLESLTVCGKKTIPLYLTRKDTYLFESNLLLRYSRPSSPTRDTVGNITVIDMNKKKTLASLTDVLDESFTIKGETLQKIMHLIQTRKRPLKLDKPLLPKSPCLIQ